MRRKILVPVTLDKANRKKDKSVSLAFTTLSEIPTEDFMIMDSFHQSSGWLLFAENELTEEEIPEEDVETDIAKSQSVQLRDALWVLYKVTGHDTADKEVWNSFYRQRMQAIKSQILSKVHEQEGK